MFRSAICVLGTRSLLFELGMLIGAIAMYASRQNLQRVFMLYYPVLLVPNDEF